MNKSLKIGLMLGIFIAGCWKLDAFGGAVEHGELPPLPVHLYDASGVSHHIRERGTREAARILGAIGVAIEWQQALPESAEASTSDESAVAFRISREIDHRNFLVVKIIRGFPDDSLVNALGFALPDARFGPHVHIFYNRIDILSRAFQVDSGVILGAAMAHEIGHVLIGSPAHDSRGIMKERWSRDECQQTEKGYLGFTVPQCELIRAGARHRLTLRQTATSR